MAKKTEEETPFEELMRLLGWIGMAGQICVMMAQARTVTHLQTLHGKRKPNMRLPKEDFITLQGAWEALEKGDDNRLSDASMEALYELSLVPDNCMHSTDMAYLYAVRINGDRGFGPVMSSDTAFQANRVVSCAERSGNGDEQFLVYMFGDATKGSLLHLQRFRAECRFSGTTLIVRLVIDYADLTEGLTHRIRTSGLGNSYRSRTASNVTFTFWIENAEAFRNLTSDFDHRALIASSAFVRAVTEHLRDKLDVPEISEKDFVEATWMLPETLLELAEQGEPMKSDLPVVVRAAYS